MVEEEVVAVTVVAIPGIYVAIQMVKLLVAGLVPPRFWPLIAIAVGIAWQVGWTFGTDEFGRETIFLGVTSGMAATGLHNLVEAGRETVTSKKNGGS